MPYPLLASGIDVAVAADAYLDIIKAELVVIETRQLNAAVAELVTDLKAVIDANIVILATVTDDA